MANPTSKYTTNIQLEQFNEGDLIDNDAVNDNYVKIDTSIGTIQTNITTQNSTISSLSGTVSSQGSTLSSLSDTVSSQGSSISSNTSSISNLTSRMSTAETNITNLQNSSSSGDYLPLTGGTLTGNLRIKNSSNYGLKINLGDGDYVHLYEPSDDLLEIKATNLRFMISNYIYRNKNSTDYPSGLATCGSYSSSSSSVTVTTGFNPIALMVCCFGAGTSFNSSYVHWGWFFNPNHSTSAWTKAFIPESSGTLYPESSDYITGYPTSTGFYFGGGGPFCKAQSAVVSTFYYVAWG